MKKNDIFQGTCIDYTEDGLGVVRQDSFVWFVKGLLKDETAEIRAISLKKNYGYGKVEKILVSSENRRTPPCPVYPKCGGCQIMHMNYEEQLSFKQKLVENAIRNIAKLNVEVQPILKADDELHYRNKVQIPLQIKDGRVCGGFYRTYSNDVVEMDACLLQSDLANEAYQKALKLTEKYGFADKVRHILIRHGFRSNEIMLVMIVREKKVRGIELFTEEICRDFKEIRTVVMNVNLRNDNVILGDSNTVLYGEGYIEDILLNRKFRISANSFYQINPAQTEKLYSAAISAANLDKEDCIADVYGGIGTIGICASAYVKKVYGVEIVEEAVKDARINSRINHIENTHYEVGDAGKAVDSWNSQNIHIDVAFIDPPRKGCDELTIQSLVKLQPRKIVYVSCNPATLARDLRKFEELGYTTQSVQPVDMFPNTRHVETVVQLSKGNISSQNVKV